MSSDNLNQKQREAVEATEGPLLLIAGAGAGKTKVITSRIAHLIENGVTPERILAVTFTNKAAAEMKERVRKLLEEKNVSKDHVPFVSTFHTLGVYILKNSGRSIGVSRWFTIFDKDESKSLIKRVMKNLNIDPKQYDPKKILGTISRQKSELVTCELYSSEAHEFYPKLVARIWKKYEEELGKQKALDFDDLLLKTVLLLQKDEKVRTYYQALWQYIHIDEYQDTNTVQYQLSKILANKHKNICVVGDMDQNIYTWRGANLTHIMNFEKDFHNTKTILLEENYRSTQNILNAANNIIKKNKFRKEKNLFTKNKEGEPIKLYEAFDEKFEASFVAGKAKELIEDGVPASEIAVLFRANFQSRVLEEVFLREGVPYQLLGTRFFERREIKDALAFIRASLNPEDFESMRRIINIPKRGIGEKTLEKIYLGQEAELSPKVREALKDFRENLEKLRKVMVEEKASTSIKFLIENSGLKRSLSNEIDGEERLENLKELVTLATKYDVFTPEEGIEKLITEASLVSDQDSLSQSKDGVKLMTVHAAKGLEFQYVFITGLEENLFPHTGMFEEDNHEERSEEERRLFYVAITRAREKVYLTYATTRTIFGNKQVNMQSEFVTELSGETDRIDNDFYMPEYQKEDGFLGNIIDLD